MVVSQSMARTLWKDADPIGKCVRMRADTNPCRTVVGVAEDIRSGSLDDAPSMHFYMPRDQQPAGRGGIYVRTNGNAADLVGVVRRELQQAMPGASYVNVTPLNNMLEPIVRSWKLGATMFSVFGIIALVLAAIGLYSVIAYNVTQRTHEMGVRVALGAQSRDVVRLIVRDGVRVAAVGIVLGAGAALVAGRWVAPLLFKVSPKDPGVFTAVVITLLAVAVTASWLPALRASRVDPNVALRTD
jgi:ABC-type antimicrobial peptide transport system permease subunit